MTTTKSKGKERYLMLRYWLLKSQAWNSLSGNARALYVELAQRYNGSNNGRISYSLREAVEALHVSQGIAHYLLGILQDRGFVICTKRGAFSLKTTKDASEWLLTEHDCDHPPAHATKDFMRWNGDFETMSQFRERKGEPRPRMTDADKERARRSQSKKTRFTAMTRTVHSDEPHGSQQRPMKSKKRQNGSQQRPIDAQNDPLTVHSNEHLQLPGRGCERGVLLPFPEGEPAEKKPWSTPTVEEVPWDTLPTELRMLVPGLPDAGVPPQVVAPDPAEKAPPAADVIDEAEKAKREAATEKQPVEPPAQPDQPSAPELVPPQPALVMQDSKEDAGLPPQVAPSAPPEMTYEERIEAIMRRQMLPGDRKRALQLVRNAEALARDNAAMKGRLH